MNIYLLLSYLYIHAIISIFSANDAEYDILLQEVNEFAEDRGGKASDYTLYFESYHFDLLNENDWDKYTISSQKIDAKKAYENSLDEAQLLIDDDDEYEEEEGEDDYYEHETDIDIEAMERAHGHRLLEEEEEEEETLQEQELEEIASLLDIDDEYNEYNDNYYDELYYNYYITNTNGDKQILNGINACSKGIKSLNNAKLCVYWHHENGLKLGVTETETETDNANQEDNNMMIEFNNDDHWNRIDIVDSLNKAAARGYMQNSIGEDDFYYDDYGDYYHEYYGDMDIDDDYYDDMDYEDEDEDAYYDSDYEDEYEEEYYDDYDDEAEDDEYYDAMLDSRRRAIAKDEDEEYEEVIGSELGFIIGGLAQKKCQTFVGYILCAKYNPSARQYKISIDIGNGRNGKSMYQINRQNIQQFAAKTLTNNMYDDEYGYDDDNDINEEGEGEEDDALNNFEFGDLFALNEQNREQMGWASLTDYSLQKQADGMEDIEEISAAKSMDSVGGGDDYTYYFDNWKFNWNNDYDWDDLEEDGGDTATEADETLQSRIAEGVSEKCTPVIPGLDHKVCLSLSQQNIGVRFAAASQAEIGDMMYDFYSHNNEDFYDDLYDIYDDVYDDYNQYGEYQEDEYGIYDGYDDYEDEDYDYNEENGAYEEYYYGDYVDDEYDDGNGAYEEYGDYVEDDYNDENGAYEEYDEYEDYDTDEFETELEDLFSDIDIGDDDYEQYDSMSRRRALYDYYDSDEDGDRAQFDEAMQVDYDDQVQDEYLYDDEMDDDYQQEFDDYYNDEDEYYDDEDYDYDGDYTSDEYDELEYYDESDAMNDDTMDALYEMYDEYDNYFNAYYDTNTMDATLQTALITEFGALGQLDFNNDDQWDTIQVINNAAKTTQEDEVYFYEDYDSDSDYNYDGYYDAEEYDEANEENDDYYDDYDEDYYDEENDDYDDDYYDEDYYDGESAENDEYYTRRRMQGPPPPLQQGPPPQAGPPPAAQGGAPPPPPGGPARKDVFKEGYEMGSLLKPQENLKKKKKRVKKKKKLMDRLTRAELFGELNGENRVLHGIRKAEMTSEAIGGGAVPGGGPPGFGYNGGKISGIRTTGGRGLVMGQFGRKRSRNGRRYKPRRRCGKGGRKCGKYSHYPIFPRAPRPHYDERDFTMPPPPPPLFSRRGRKRKKKPSITVKHYHYNMGRPRRRRKRRHRMRRRRKPRRRRRKRTGRALVKTILGPNLGKYGHRLGRKRRKRRRRRRRPRGKRRRRKKHRRRRKRRRKKRIRSFGAQMDENNMENEYEYYYEDDMINAFGAEAMSSTLNLMDLGEYDGSDERQLRKCKTFSMTETCVTLDAKRGDVQLEVSVGSLKAKEGYAAHAWQQENGENEYYEYTDEDVEDEWFDETEQTAWMVSDVAADEEYDDLWNDDTNWEQIDEIQTLSGNRLQRKCLHLWGQRLCLCQFLAFLDNRKFQCQPKGLFYNPLGPGPGTGGGAMTQSQMKEIQSVQSIKSIPKIPKISKIHKKSTGVGPSEKSMKKEIKKVEKVKAVKPQMSKNKLKKVVNKALKKAVEKAGKKEKAAILAKKKRGLLIPKHLPYRFEGIKLPKTPPKWLPHWMWHEFTVQNEQHKQEKKTHTAIKKKLKEGIKKQRAKEQKQIKKEEKVLLQARKQAEKQIKKEIAKEIKSDEVKAAVETQKKAVKVAKKAVKKAKVTEKEKEKLKKATVKVIKKKVAADIKAAVYKKLSRKKGGRQLSTREKEKIKKKAISDIKKTVDKHVTAKSKKSAAMDAYYDFDDEYYDDYDEYYDDMDYYDEYYDDEGEMYDDYDYESYDLDDDFYDEYDDLDYDSIQDAISEDEDAEEEIDEEYEDALDQLYYDVSNYYDDYDGMYYYEDVSDNEEYSIAEKAHWHDDRDDNDWVVSSLSTSDLDNVWEDPSEWELVDKVKTASGRMVQRKCLHMWQHRLCLCQFLEWIDDAKYKCYPRGQAMPIMKKTPKLGAAAPSAPKVVKKFKKIVKKLRVAQKPGVAQKPLLAKLSGDIKKLETIEQKRAAETGQSNGKTKSLLKKLAIKLGKKAQQQQPVRPGKARRAYPPKKLMQKTIQAGNGVRAMAEMEDMANPPLPGDYAVPHDTAASQAHNAQLSHIEALLAHLLAAKTAKGGGKPAALAHYSPSESESAEHGYTTPDEVRRRYRHSERLWRKRQRGEGPGGKVGKKHGLGRALGGMFKDVNYHSDRLLNSPRDFWGGHKLPKFGDHPGHGDVSGHGFRGDIPNVPLHWHLAGVHAPNIGPQQHLIMSQPAHPDYPKKSYYMLITGYPKYGLPENRPHWIPSYMWSQMQALQHRGIDVAQALDEENELVYEEMTGDYDDYDWYLNNGAGYYDEEEFEDEWFDKLAGEQWVVMQDVDGLDGEIVSEEEWDNDELWDLMEKAETEKGVKVEKKCMNVFGRSLCLCQLIDWVERGEIKKKQCGPKSVHKIVAPPKKKPKWMPHNFWGYLNNVENPHKRPSDINRRKWKLYLKFKKKGFKAGQDEFGDELLYDDGLYDDGYFDDELLDDDDVMDGLLDYGYDEEYMDDADYYDDEYDADYYDADYYDADYYDDYYDDEYDGEYYDEYDGDYYEDEDDILLDELLDGDYADYDEEEKLLDELLADVDERDYEEYDQHYAAKTALLDKLLENEGYEYDDYDYDYEDYDDYEDYMDDDYEDYDDYDYDDGEYDDEYYLDDDYEESIETSSEAAENVADWWVDDDDASEWIVTDKATHDYDDKWDSDGEWQQISKRIRTKSGHLMTRKCLSIWKKRLCFCQFLNWIDGRKYKCMPRRQSYPVEYATDIDMDQDYQQNYEDEEYYDEDYYDEDYDQYDDEDYQDYYDEDEYATAKEAYEDYLDDDDELDDYYYDDEDVDYEEYGYDSEEDEDYDYFYDDEEEDGDLTDDYLEALLSNEMEDYEEYIDDNDILEADYFDDGAIKEYLDLYESLNSMDGEDYLQDDIEKYSYLTELEGILDDLQSFGDIDEDDMDSLDGLREIDDYSTLNNNDKKEYNKQMKALQGYMDELIVDDYDDEEYGDMVAEYNKNNNDDIYSYAYGIDENENDIYDGYDQDEGDDEWSNANHILNDYYQYAQKQEDVDAYANLYEDEDEDEYEYEYDDEEGEYNDGYDNMDIDEYYEDGESDYNDGNGGEYYENYVAEDGDYGYDNYAEDGYNIDDDDDYYDEYNDEHDVISVDGDNAYIDYDDEIVDGEYNNDEDEYNDEANYNEEDDDYYDNEDDFYADSDEEEYIENIANLENNAWVWQLLILSFSLGVCSCLCYYATKVKPSGGSSYDFRHQKGKYNKVSFESAHSAYDHDDIIDQQSDIEQTN